MPDFQTKTVSEPKATQLPTGLDTQSLPSGVPAVNFFQANKLYIGFIVFAVLIIGLLAFFAFRPAPPAVLKEAKVTLQISAPETLPSGSEIIYRIQAKNDDSITLTGLELEIAYPEGISYAQSTPKANNLSGSVFSLPELLPGQNLNVIIKAVAVGEINSEKTLQTKLHYKYVNFNSAFSKSAQQIVRLVAAKIDLEIDGPKETNTAQLVAYTVKYKNRSGETIKNARIQLTYPVGFNYGASQPTASLGGNIWNLGDVQPEGAGQIVVQGSFASSQPGESKKLVASFLSLGDSGEFYVQASAETETLLVNQPLILTLENLDQDDQGVVNPGGSLIFSVRYQNNSQVAATGVNIVVSLESKALDINTLKAQSGQISGNTISWNASGVPALESLNPGEQGSLNFSVSIKNPATKDSTKNLTVKLGSKIKANEYSSFLPGETAEYKISSPANLSAELRYLSGSLPPKVGTQTKYKLKINLSNSSNDFSSGEVSFFLPGAGLGFNENSITASEQANVQFDPSTGKLVWKFGSLPAFSGKFSPNKILELEVVANPAPSDVGDFAVLARSFKFVAQDSFTGQEVILKTEDISSASLLGKDGNEFGTVVP